MEKWNLRERFSRYELCLVPCTPSGSGEPIPFVSAHRSKMGPILPALQPIRLPDGYLDPGGAQRLALGILGANLHARARAYIRGLQDLPDEVILYWFTGCFYGFRKRAFRTALKALILTGGDS